MLYYHALYAENSDEYAHYPNLGLIHKQPSHTLSRPNAHTRQ